MMKERKRQECGATGESSGFDWRIQILLPFIVALVSAILGGLSTFLPNYFAAKSELAAKCGILETKLQVSEARVEEKGRQIEEQRVRIASIEEQLRARETQLSVKADFCSLLQMIHYDKTGQVFTNASDLVCLMSAAPQTECPESPQVMDRESAIRTLTSGTVFERLGIAPDASMREAIIKGWDKPLYVDELPCVVLPAPRVALDGCLGYLDALATNDLATAVVSARRAHAVLSPIIDPFICHGAQMDARLALVASIVYQAVAEDEFSRGNYRTALSCISTAAGVVGTKPAPILLAKESAMLSRCTGGVDGYFTRHIADAIAYAKDDNYTYQIHDELAKLGYLQLFFPNKDGTGIGERIDWNKFGKGRVVHTRATFIRNGEVWSTRWKGYNQNEEYNLSAEFSRTLKVGKDTKR